MDYLFVLFIMSMHVFMAIMTAAIISEPNSLNLELLMLKSFLISILTSIPMWILIFEGTRNAKRK